MWTASDGKHNLALRTTWTAAIVCPAFSADHISAGPDEVRQPRGHIKDASFEAHTTGRVFLVFGGDRCLSSCLSCTYQAYNSSMRLSDTQSLANISVRKHSPVFIIAQMIRASLLARATVTSRAGFFSQKPDNPVAQAAAAFFHNV